MFRGQICVGLSKVQYFSVSTDFRNVNLTEYISFQHHRRFLVEIFSLRIPLSHARRLGHVDAGIFADKESFFYSLPNMHHGQHVRYWFCICLKTWLASKSQRTEARDASN
jgi:hypothetical protein